MPADGIQSVWNGARPRSIQFDPQARYVSRDSFSPRRTTAIARTVCRDRDTRRRAGSRGSKPSLDDQSEPAVARRGACGAETPGDHRMLQKVATVQRECQRLEAILDEFLRFARLGELELSESDLNHEVREFIDFYQGKQRQREWKSVPISHRICPPFDSTGPSSGSAVTGTERQAGHAARRAPRTADSIPRRPGRTRSDRQWKRHGFVDPRANL